MHFKLLSAHAVQREKAHLVICQSGMLICLSAGSLAKMLPKRYPVCHNFFKEVAAAQMDPQMTGMT